MLERSSKVHGRWRFWLITCVALSAVGVKPNAALAQASAAEKAVAESLFVEGKDLMTEGRHSEACPKLEQSQSIEAAIGTMLYLAECYEKVGRMASAWAMFREASSRARAEGQPDRAQVGAERAKIIEPKLSKLTVVVDSQGRPPDLSLALDGRPLPLSLQGTAIPVDAGEHVVSAEASGHEPFRAPVTLRDPADSATVLVPALKPLATTAAEPEPAAVDLAPVTSDADAAPASGSDTQEIVGLALGGAGVLAVGVGVYFGIEAMDQDDQAEALCPRSEAECNDQNGIDLTEEAQSDAFVANVLYGVGGAAMIAGAILYFTADDASEQAGASAPSFGIGKARVRPDAVFTPTYSGVSLHAEF